MPHDAVVVLARAPGELGSVSVQLREAVQSAAPGSPVHDVRTLRDRLAGEEAVPKFLAGLAAVFSVTALALAAIGLYGVLAYSVAGERREIALRMAVGATPGRISSGVVRRGVALAGAGLAAGVGVAVLGGRSLSTVLHEVEPTDPSTFAVVGVVLLGVTSVASLIPALRAARVNPIQMLQSD